jgi:F-type H+-transporting ATPase subunit delta
MSDNDFLIDAVGTVYAQALINEAQKVNALDEITEDVRGLATLLKENKAFLAFTRAVMIDENERIAAIEKIFAGRVHPLTLSLLKSLSRRERFMFLPSVTTTLEKILKKMSGHVDVELISASQLSPDLLERIKQAVGKSIGKTADVKITLNPALVGGMTLRVGDTLIDGSVATQLEKIEEQLKRHGVSKLQRDISAVIA